ncbi:enoyl-CoA hydratase/isomerase family protein [Psychrobacillus lasiicapitis]|uniref:Enoyl-CoA hydratase n=1 Tax=Psychrobacillus lasiicapitis TaxID=1636719 RepID=A0A544T310_9BACI|nr:enoyl-CoA hydratase-related protein [Psychrobacillus lasiicapitis]TQR11818.1 enoyl-CoA hydratase [Psychrobacillus lasiicapitis]GGA19698.1 3-hydroxybutyryl-CoA dehydratase [Psychrobacillus lasiicapitis]
MKNWDTIKLIDDHKNDNIYVLQLNRPEAMNALNTQMGKELIECFQYLETLKDLRVLILTGSGEKSFCVGGDLKERKGMSQKDWKLQHDIFEEAYEAIRNFSFPTVAAVNGFALGGGLEMALSCDLCYVAEHARIGLPEVKIGIIPGAGGTQLLPRAIPIKVAKEFLYSGKHMTSTESREFGLANGVFPGASLLEGTLEAVKGIAKNAPLSLKALKQSIDKGIQTDIEKALSIELEEYYKCANSQDREEGILAFNEKRDPVWQGV